MNKSNNIMVDKFRHALRKFERELDFLQCTNFCADLTLAQCHTLLEIGNLKQTSVMNLAGSLNLDKSTVSRTVDGLVNAGLVSRIIPEENRRAVVISLTAKGIETYDIINQQNNTYFEEVLSSMPADDRKKFIEAFELLADTMVLKNKRNDK